MGWTLKKTVVLVGMMGAGKTAVGKALATDLGVPFLDSDHEIEKAANMNISEIFERDGEAFFRLKEAQIIERLLEEKCGILSTGGGAFLAQKNREMISDMGVSVWLNADIDILWKRVKSKDTRPLLRTANPYERLKDMYDARLPLYRQADITVRADPQYSIAVMAKHVALALKNRPDILEDDT